MPINKVIVISKPTSFIRIAQDLPQYTAPNNPIVTAIPSILLDCLGSKNVDIILKSDKIAPAELIFVIVLLKYLRPV